MWGNLVWWEVLLTMVGLEPNDIKGSFQLKFYNFMTMGL